MQMKIVLKLLVLGGLSILLLIALSSVGGIAGERKGRLHEVQQNIADSYAGPQRVIGPVVQLEYREIWMGKLYNKEKDLWYEKEMSQLHTSLVYPQMLQFDGSLEVTERYRGIFKAHVFQSSGCFTGLVKFPKEEYFRSENDSRIEMLSAKATLLVSDPRGISKVPVFEWAGEPLEIQPASAIKKDGAGVHVVLPEPGGLFGRKFEFKLDLSVHGMGLFEIVPVGSDNGIRLESSWPHPSFIGNFLASDRTVSDIGFAAEWDVNGLACSAQQDMDAGRFSQLQSLGVSLIDPVNVYPMTDRALKYGFLFIFITFAAFFLFELVKQLKIHPVQYGFVGLAQAIFFLLLLSLSEHIGFGVSYFIASAATSAVISLYLCSVLKGFRRGALFGVILALLYGTLFGLLQSEDHALVAGSGLLFSLLALVMILTRKVDWYALGGKPQGRGQ
jgi:inner membrane protein